MPIIRRHKVNRTVLMVVIYHCTKAATQGAAAATSATGCVGTAGQYLSVRNKASEYGLSSLTRGRLNDGMTPNRSSVPTIDTDFSHSLTHCSAARAVPPLPITRGLHTRAPVAGALPMMCDG